MAINGNLSFGNAVIQVTPESLTTQASDVASKISALKVLFDSMNTNVDKTSGYWIGEGGDAHRNLFRAQHSEIDEVMSILSERVSELNQMASNYTTNEQSTTGVASSLPTDVIS